MDPVVKRRAIASVTAVFTLFAAGCGGADGADAEASSARSPTGLAVNSDGQICVDSRWTGLYNIVDNNCHNAAADNVDATNGFISCTTIGSWQTGHTINWTRNPTATGTNDFCAYEPRYSGACTDAAVCCWTGRSNTQGVPDLTDDAAKPCIIKLCQGQASYGWFSTKPLAWPPGVKPPVADDCSTVQDEAGCAKCCDSQAYAQISNWWWDKGIRAQTFDFERRCRQSCGESEGVAQGWACVNDTTFWSWSSRLTQCLDCCATTGYGTVTGSASSECDSVCSGSF